MKPNISLFRFTIFDAKENERNITENTAKETSPYPHIDELAGPLLPSVVMLFLKNNLIMTPTIVKAIKLLIRYSLVVVICAFNKSTDKKTTS